MSDVPQCVRPFGYGNVHYVFLYKGVLRRLATVACLELSAEQQSKLKLALQCR